MILAVVLSIIVFSSASIRQIDINVTFNGLDSTPKYRLSGNVKPSFYSIKIHPDLTKEVFTGEVLIHIKIDQAAKFIELHSSSLQIDSLHFDANKVQDISKNASLSYNDFGYNFSDYELIRIVRGHRQLLAPGAHVLHIEYHGQFSKKEQGIFKAKSGKNGERVSYLMATDFEPTFARQAFPCFDEPRFKAQFQLSLVVPDYSYKALSNMRTIEKFGTSDGVVHEFEPTPLMSTYLLCFIITNHSYIEYIDDSGLPFKMYASDEIIKDTKFLKHSSLFIKFYSTYTRYDYNLPKIDFVGYDRIDGSAMENWGLVTFNSSFLSPDNSVYDENQKLNVIGHELAHLWFGNLVTNDWWDDIWLQEGLATFMSNKAQEFIFQNEAYRYFLTMDVMTLLWKEPNTNSTAVINFQKAPAKFNEIFNDIVYIKGPTVLRMLELVMGEEQLRSGIVEYIQKYAFKTVTTSDFLNVVTQFSSEVNLREFIETYLYQSKYPVITVEEEADRYVLKQQSCVQVPNNKESPYRYKWTVPISYITDSNKNFTNIWFHKDEASLSIPKNKTTWIKFNYRQIGYYVVHYSTNLWEKLMKHSQELDLQERHNLLLEATSSYITNHFSCESALIYLWDLSDSSHGSLVEVYMYTTYWTLAETVKHDREALSKLKNFFERVLQRAQKKELAKEFLTESDQIDQPQSAKGGTQVESCIEWLKHKSELFVSVSSSLDDWM